MKIEDRLDRIEAMLNTETWGDDVQDIVGRTLDNTAIVRGLLDYLGLEAEIDADQEVHLRQVAEDPDA